jgi:Aromatic-ring-opening dioxygenase LigAB, LigA subunit
LIRTFFVALRREKNLWHTTVVAGKKTEMSVFQVNKLLYLTDNDPAFRKRMMEEPEVVIKEFSLTQEERDALTSGAVGKLHRMGVHTFLLNHLYRYELFGVNRDNYLSRIREGMPYDPRFELGNMPVQRFIKK